MARPLTMRAAPGAPALLAMLAVVAMTISPAAGGAGSSALTGKVWIVKTLRGKAPVAGTELIAEFRAGKVAGSGGCNRYSGRYTTRGSSIRVSSRLVSTQIACASRIARQEATFLRALQSARTFKANAKQLTLRTAGGAVLVVFDAQTQALQGTSWTAVGYNNGKEAVVSPLVGTELTLLVGKSGALSGSAGCNTFNGTATLAPPKIAIGPLASTRKHCAEPEGVMEQESRYLAALETAATYRVEGKRLELRTVDGALAAQFVRA